MYIGHMYARNGAIAFKHVCIGPARVVFLMSD